MPSKATAIYLDNAATSFPKPPELVATTTRLLQETALSPGRAAHSFSLSAGRVIFAAREAVAELFGCSDASRVVFTANATEALNLAILGLLAPGDRVLTTGIEHNSVMRPLRFLEKNRGVGIDFLPTSAEGRIDPDDIQKALSGATRLIIINHCSNVTGALADLAAIGARKAQALLLVDAAQSAGITPIDVEAMAIDFLAFTGHKSLFGPTGTGGLILGAGRSLMPLKTGGTGSNSEREEQPDWAPDRYEAGTPNTLGIGGLAAGIAFIKKHGLEAIRAHEAKLTGLLLNGLNTLPGVSLYGPPAGADRGALISLTSDKASPAELAFALDRRFGIMARAGLHCAPAAHRSIGTFPQGTLRLSPGFFNTEAEMTLVIEALDQILHSIKA